MTTKGSGSFPLPWQSWEEYDWVARQSCEEYDCVVSGLFSETPERMKAALDKVEEWQRKGGVPKLRVVEVTVGLVRAQLKGSTFINVKPGGPENEAPSELDLRVHYSMAIQRLVNVVADEPHGRFPTSSLTTRATAMGLSPFLVGVRHDAAHRDLPELHRLQVATVEALGWLKINYWQKQRPGFCNLDHEDGEISDEYVDRNFEAGQQHASTDQEQRRIFLFEELLQVFSGGTSSSKPEAQAAQCLSSTSTVQNLASLGQGCTPRRNYSPRAPNSWHSMPAQPSRQMDCVRKDRRIVRHWRRRPAGRQQALSKRVENNCNRFAAFPNSGNGASSVYSVQDQSKRKRDDYQEFGNSSKRLKTDFPKPELSQNPVNSSARKSSKKKKARKFWVQRLGHYNLGTPRRVRATEASGQFYDGAHHWLY